MAVRLEILTNATVTFQNGQQRHFEAIYPTHNGLYTGTISSETSIYEKSCRRRFGLSKPIQKKEVNYLIFSDNGFLRNGSYTFFSGDETVAYTQKLTNGELRNKLY